MSIDTATETRWSFSKSGEGICRNSQVKRLDSMAVTASARALSQRPPARAPQLWGACSAACSARDRAEIAPEKHRPTSLSHRGLCGVSKASHRATHKEVGHGEP